MKNKIKNLSRIGPKITKQKPFYFLDLFFLFIRQSSHPDLTHQWQSCIIFIVLLCCPDIVLQREAICKYLLNKYQSLLKAMIAYKYFYQQWSISIAPYYMQFTTYEAFSPKYNTTKKVLSSPFVLREN